MRPGNRRLIPTPYSSDSRALADHAVKLRRDEARMLLHERRVALPGLKVDLFIGLVEREDVHQHDGGCIDRELAFDRKGRVQWAQQRHDRLRSIGCRMSIWYDGAISNLTSRCQ